MKADVRNFVRAILGIHRPLLGRERLHGEELVPLTTWRGSLGYVWSHNLPSMPRHVSAGSKAGIVPRADHPPQWLLDENLSPG